MLLERLSLDGIARIPSISESWLQSYINQFYQEVPKQAQVLPKEKGQLTVQMDELWSFVDSKTNRQWVWLAMDADTREIIACHIGDGSRQSAQSLWDALPCGYRQCAKVSDYWEAYQTGIPSKCHEAVGKDSGKTSYIERLNNTFRERIARLVRKSLSFSKQVGNHIGAIWYFIGEYNRQIRLKIEADKMASRYYPPFT